VPELNLRPSFRTWVSIVTSPACPDGSSEPRWSRVGASKRGGQRRAAIASRYPPFALPTMSTWSYGARPGGMLSHGIGVLSGDIEFRNLGRGSESR